MNPNVKKIIKFLFGFLISFIFIYLAFNKLDFKEILKYLFSVKISFLVLSVFITTLSIAIKAIRWKYIIPEGESIQLNTLIKVNYISFMINNIFPAKFGDVAKAYILGKKQNISKTKIFASVVFERIIDVFSIIFMFLITILFFPEINEQIKKYFIINFDLRIFFIISISILLFIGSIYYLLLKFRRSFVIRIINFFLKPIPEKIKEKIKNLLRKFHDGIGFSGHKRSFVLFIIFTFIYWLFIFLGIMILFFSFNFGDILTAPFLIAIIVTVTSGVASSIPFTPANLGTLQFAVIVTLSIFNVDTNEAGAYSIISHLSNWLIQILLGLFIFLSDKNYKIKENKKEVF
ncbi:MAG: hypothetical protein A2Y41_05950 [Spirochaetes bacterium GWB1_36_13]|nr:MAG: hypothetical protein A2Y41_05950 [Spirochaetes bacterium GWB1_36_13]